MTNRQTERAYLAGLIEGEGTIYVRRQRSGDREYLYPTVRIAMTDKDVLDNVAEMVGHGNVVGPYENTKYKDGVVTKPIYQWAVHGPHAIKLLKAVAPWLSSRRLEQMAKVLLAKGRTDALET
jgi:hypothetical protein